MRAHEPIGLARSPRLVLLQRRLDPGLVERLGLWRGAESALERSACGTPACAAAGGARGGPGFNLGRVPVPGIASDEAHDADLDRIAGNFLPRRARAQERGGLLAQSWSAHATPVHGLRLDGHCWRVDAAGSAPGLTQEVFHRYTQRNEADMRSSSGWF